MNAITVRLTYQINVPAGQQERARAAIAHADAPYECADLCWRVSDEIARLLGLPITTGPWNSGCEAVLDRVEVK